MVDVQPDPAGLQRLIVTAPEFDASFEVYGNCPVQGFGSVLGRFLYFRARHDGWSFEVADHAGNLPSDGYFDSDGFYRDGDYPNAGWMPHRKAVAIIERCLREFTD
jgi:L-amino acid N-acyltransferase YncA